ncbi:BREX-2 system phosphatase PglZ [Mesorhizobium sp. P16.1]|uniref:BREX-2 system phosphatase PglZ n=2 Tax=Mesorhizobium TaxID=68287 RepID=UPI0021A7FCC1|nr:MULTISPECIES: BREX-2 system phosphatase PglZ [unclassified Mesorhizobium]MCT2580892.1 BREX-2 system phosphatase PglZ [Mesorhizobium sp. P13.3]MDF3169969.1 BREX-2 system phosphatase PglZ [Mesorhizobium sp. P16.1]
MSPLLAPDLPDIERALDNLLQKDGNARILGLRSPIRRAWPEALERHGRRFRIAWCPSELEVREQLDEAETNDDEGLVVVTPLDAATLGDDVIARFPRARLDQTDRWSALRGAFRARDLDPRLRAHRWLADLLLSRPAGHSYPPAAGGVLDLESAWRAALDIVLGLPDGRADATALLDWTLDPAGMDRFARLSEEARNAVTNRLAADGGPAAGLVLAAAAARRGDDALATGLACGVVFGEPAPPPVLREAAIRLEPMFGGAQVNPDAGRALAEAARRVFDRMARGNLAAARAIESRAVTILKEIRAVEFAALSPSLQIGLEARLDDAAKAISRAVETTQRDDAANAWRLTRHAVDHDGARESQGRLERLTMAARLVQWITTRPVTGRSDMSDAATAYATDGSFVDRARHLIRSGDPLPNLAAAYTRLRDAVTERREAENRSFAQSLREWNSDGSQGDKPIPVERILTRIVAPLAREAPILLLVLDGLSLAVWRALAETIGRLGWTELVESGQSGLHLAAAALPSVTSVSRASLLCGDLTRGDQKTERTGFAAHRQLVAASRSGHPPRLFHKADIGPGPELGAGIRSVVADPLHRVVGVVHNAVDAQLAGSDQLDLTWTAEGLRQVAALLHAARDAGRILVVTGDHGHVLDEGTIQLGGGSGDRWRPSAPPPQDKEILLSGGRVLSSSGEREIIAAWSEKVRFSAKRGGYHGGASPQEILVPIAVLSAGVRPEGWYEAPPPEPSWWRGATEDVTHSVTVRADGLPVFSHRRPADPKQADLFMVEQHSDADQRPVRQEVSGPAWLDSLLASSTYSAQRRLSGRGAPSEELLRRLLVALNKRGGRMTRAGLSQAVGMPTFRLGGLVSAARRVLNLDQAQVLKDEGDDIVLDETLLKDQFGLGDDQ